MQKKTRARAMSAVSKSDDIATIVENLVKARKQKNAGLKKEDLAKQQLIETGNSFFVGINHNIQIQDDMQMRLDMDAIRSLIGIEALQKCYRPIAIKKFVVLKK